MKTKCWYRVGCKHPNGSLPFSDVVYLHSIRLILVVFRDLKSAILGLRIVFLSLFFKVTIIEKCSILILCHFGPFSFRLAFLERRLVYVSCDKFPLRFFFGLFGSICWFSPLWKLWPKNCDTVLKSYESHNNFETHYRGVHLVIVP